ncbi:MAG TPA: group III truncated hemoglobin [Arenibaculum sp.]|nr:group III truncated hemoglobin [Arenibaculum sp.]
MTTAMQRRSGIDAEGITALVDTFYTKVRSDPRLGPVFERTITDWEPHLETMRRFWSSVMLGTATYQGTPMRKHAALEGLSPELFAHWLTLFDATAAELFEPPLAAGFSERAHRIARSLQLGIFYRPGRVAGT